MNKNFNNPLISLRNYSVFLIIALNLIFNYSFMQVRIPLLFIGEIPLNEWVLGLSLLTIPFLSISKQLNYAVYLPPFIMWLVYGLISALSMVSEHGLWALRDANHIIESLFLLLGFVCVSRTDMREKFFRWFPVILGFICIYAIGFPYMHELQELSPKIDGGSGQVVSLFFNYTNTPALMILAASYLLIFCNKKYMLIFYLLALAITLYSILVFQSRAVYLQVIVITILLMIYKEKFYLKTIVATLLSILFLLLIDLFDLNFYGRLNQTISIDFIFNHFQSIFGITAEGMESATGGVNLRLNWWSQIYQNWSENVGTVFFGLGYGNPLLDFNLSKIVAVREPHNSYISILARGGLIGASLWLWMHFLLLREWKRLYSNYSFSGNREGENRILILLIFIILILVSAIGADSFEKPFNVIPYYFFWGIILRLAFNEKINNYA